MGVCCDWHTLLSVFPVAPAADKNTTDYHGNDQDHQAHRDQDDGGTQRVVLQRYTGICCILCGWNKTVESRVLLRPYSVLFNAPGGISMAPDPISALSTEVSSTGRQRRKLELNILWRIWNRCVCACACVKRKGGWWGLSTLTFFICGRRVYCLGGFSIVLEGVWKDESLLTATWQRRLKNQKHANAKPRRGVNGETRGFQVCAHIPKPGGFQPFLLRLPQVSVSPPPPTPPTS